MGKKQKRKLTTAEKREKKRRRKEYEIVFINGKQKRVKRPQKIDGLDVDEFIYRNADPIWLHPCGGRRTTRSGTPYFLAAEITEQTG